jgi:hypothetical protein
MATIPFDEIMQGSSVRVALIHGTQYLSIRDVIMHMCQKEMDQAGLTWRNLSDQIKAELNEHLLLHKFPGRGQQEQPVITFPGAIKLAMFLPGENAKKNRSAMTSILTRYFAGDPSLIREIQANGESSAPVPQLARATLQRPPALEARKRGREVDEFAEMERRMALKERQIAIKEKEISIKHQEIMNVQSAKATMDLLIPDWKADSRLKLQMEDWAKNTIFGQRPVQPLLGNAPHPQNIPNPQHPQHAPLIPNPQHAPNTQTISISQVAMELGHRLRAGDLVIMGKLVAKAYRDKYNENPGKHLQWVDGAEREVNSYTERDRDLLASVVRQYVGAN